MNTLVVISSDTEELALNLNGKKRKIIWRDWASAMKLSGVPEKVMENMRQHFLRVLPQWENTIRSSFLSPEMQEEYLLLIRSRLEQLFK